MHDDALRGARRIAASLDPLLVDLGFAAGQVGGDSSAAGIVFCSPYRDIRTRFPRVAPAIDSDDPAACTDVYVTLAGSPPHVTEVRLDGIALTELLRGAGREDLVPQADLSGKSIGAAAERLGELLRVAFAPVNRAS